MAKDRIAKHPVLRRSVALGAADGQVEAQNPGVWLGRPPWSRVKHHFAGLARPTNGFPFEIVAMLYFIM
jgi:hypothetical protein